ncbi:exocyst complex component Sec6 [Raphidocelis subcapitata]|uniref:Exocyst complex component Sec6 n=1 Tax=Raphidocelis subcapitata TaxID=307507 RepID=A0A2V0NNQ6_9CHLO|nr:exocyst complex component Sec6 [Raphidocelis subcapitata]|eukprot:GBF89218.1 exocyst complex component Sec6 [Raphidocelis subcapitata]
MVDIGQMAFEAAEAGVAEVVRLLQAPEDLERLPQLVTDAQGRARANQAALSAALGAQVDAARYGLELLDRSHRHIARLRSAIEEIGALCAEAGAFVEDSGPVRALSLAHLNVSAVLAELSDIVDLPARAAAVEQLVGDDTSLVAAYEGLTVLEGTAANVKEAWKRNAAKRRGIGELFSYLDRVEEAMEAFEARLWAHARNYRELARSNPRLLVDVARVVEIQERLDEHCRRTKAGYVKPRHYRERLMVELAAAIRERAAPVIELCKRHGVPNVKLKFDQHGNKVVSEARDYLGALTDVVRVDPVSGRQLPAPTDEELASLAMREEEAFEEDTWLGAALGGLAVLEADLPEAYDYAAPCFPPHLNAFDALFQMYHVQIATAVDALGQASSALTAKGQLAVIDWVVAYQGTLRGLGVQEELVRLPVAPLSDDTRPGLALLIEAYTGRMEATLNAWAANILAQDVAGAPQQMSDGTLRTPGAVDFFRLLNEHVAVVEEVSRGEVLYAAACRALKVMCDFTASQSTLLARGGLPLEMLAALLNNNVDAYGQSLEFTEHVQSLLEEGYAGRLDVEDTCRSFLELAKALAAAVCSEVMRDAGLAEQFGRLYAGQDWASGATTATVVATLKDYFGDVSTFVEPGFAKRIAEMALDEVVRRYTAALASTAPPASEAALRRMTADVEELSAFFGSLMPAARASKGAARLCDLRELLAAKSPAEVVAAYGRLLDAVPSLTPQQLERIAAGSIPITPQQ